MIRALRRRHRAMVLGLVVLVAPLCVTGIALRRTIPVVPPPLAGYQSLDLDPGRAAVRTIHAFDRGAVQLTVWRAASGPRAALESLAELEQPDVLIYWADPAPAPGSRWDPATGRLLGRLVDRHPASFDLPPGDGGLVLYSLPRGEPVVVLAPPAVPPAGGAG